MLVTLILAASISGQSPPKTTTAPTKAQQNARLIAKRKAKTAEKSVRNSLRSARAAYDLRREEEEATALALKMAPIQLEQQRQAILAADVAARAEFLRRAAGAMEKQAGYSYPGQSPTVGPYATTIPINPMYSRLIP